MTPYPYPEWLSSPRGLWANLLLLKMLAAARATLANATLDDIDEHNAEVLMRLDPQSRGPAPISGRRDA
jgi:hypothetical protein